MERAEARGPSRAASERDRAARRRRTSIRVGAAGIVIFFAAGLGIGFSRSNTAPLLAIMIVGLMLIIAAFILLRPLPGAMLQKPRR